MSQPFRGLTAAAAAMIASVTAIPLLAQTSTDVLEGAAAFGDWHADRPGTRRLIRPQDLPPPDLSASASNFVRIVRRADDQKPIVPNGFDVNLFAPGLTRPRLIRVAPNGDVFAAESGAGQIRVLRPNGKDAPKDAVQSSIFASGLRGPFGIAFYPSGADPQWVYIGNTNSVVRFPYRNGDLVARGAAEIIVPRLPTGGHITRDVAFSPDGQTMYVSVGSEGNVGDDMGRLSAAGLQKWQTEQPLGAARGDETGRADVLAFDPQGKNGRIFATGIRNCVGLAIEPTSGTPWCSTNERDGLGITCQPTTSRASATGRSTAGPGITSAPMRIHAAKASPRSEGQGHRFGHPHPGPLGLARPDLLQCESVSGGLSRQHLCAEHGSWNRSKRTGYKVIRAIVKAGVPTGVYEDFVTGFVVNDSTVWGRPVGVAVDKDGDLLVSEDAIGTIWRISYSGRAADVR